MSSIPRSYIDDIRRIVQSVLNQLESLKVRSIHGLEEVNGVAWTGVGGGTKKIFIPVTYIDGFSLITDDDFPAWEVNASTNGVARGTIIIPPDYVSGAKIYSIARATSSGTGDLEVSADYGAIGESHTTHNNSAGGTLAMTTNIIKSADVVLSNASAGDYVGVKNLTYATYNDVTIRLYGFILEYES